MRLNPHLHTIALDGTWHEDGDDLVWQGLGHLQTREVGDVLERTVRRIERHLRRKGLLRTLGEVADSSGEGDPERNLAASAVVRPGAACRAAVGVRSPATRVACARVRQAALCVDRRVQPARGHPRGRA